jgi:hypothetical protein
MLYPLDLEAELRSVEWSVVITVLIVILLLILIIYFAQRTRW